MKLLAWRYGYISTIENMNMSGMKMSGWKLYIYGNCEADSVKAQKIYTEICHTYNFTIKFATKGVIERNQKRKPAWGVGVIYLDNQVFGKDYDDKWSLFTFLKNLELLGNNYYGITGCHPGSLRLSPTISCRYDLSIPIQSNIGVSYEDYLTFYRGEYGDYNIPDNKLPHEFSNYINCKPLKGSF